MKGGKGNTVNSIRQARAVRNPREMWIVLPDGPNQFDREVRAGALACAKDRGFTRIRLADENAIRMNYFRSPVFRNGKLGVIAHVSNTVVLKALIRFKVPTVLLGKEPLTKLKKLMGDACTVCSVDNESIGRMAAEYLEGQNRYASYMYADGMSLKKWAWWTRRRSESFRAHLSAHCNRGAKVVQIYIRDNDPETDAEAFRATISKLPKPVGVFACNDQVAREVVNFCLLAGLQIPEDVGVLGVDNDVDICETSPVAISSIKVEHQRLGREAMDILIHALNSEGVRNRSILCPPTRVVERSSTRKAPPNNAFVAKAVDFIAAATCRDITVVDVVRACGTSYSYIEKHFKNATGRTILKAIHAKRMADVSALLLDTELPISLISDKAAFKSAPALCTLFKRSFGMSMGDYRAAHRRMRQ